ncbi:unnamed protein product [Acanthosepion pharaonis]|uniref:Uncharacterized protein n=1 Tax=Acanthosepion pharaonis TaxID=158019 RepID=A0A812DJ20_ACAPH|nr:unnamed protein product [Sepia pharaonis]
MYLSISLSICFLSFVLFILLILHTDSPFSYMSLLIPFSPYSLFFISCSFFFSFFSFFNPILFPLSSRIRVRHSSQVTLSRYCIVLPPHNSHSLLPFINGCSIQFLSHPPSFSTAYFFADITATNSKASAAAFSNDVLLRLHCTLPTKIIHSFSSFVMIFLSFLPACLSQFFY